MSENYNVIREGKNIKRSYDLIKVAQPSPQQNEGEKLKSLFDQILIGKKLLSEERKIFPHRQVITRDNIKEIARLL